VQSGERESVGVIAQHTFVRERQVSWLAQKAVKGRPSLMRIAGAGKQQSRRGRWVSCAEWNRLEPIHGCCAVV
jgi:hypothetical protein